MLDVFDFGESPLYDASDFEQFKKVEQALNSTGGDEERDRLKRHLTICSARYLLSSNLERILRHFDIASQIHGSDNVVVRLNPFRDGTVRSISIGIGNGDRRVALERLASYFGKKGIDIRRAYLETFKQGAENSVLLLGFLLDSGDLSLFEPQSEQWKVFEYEIKRLILVDEQAISLADSAPGLSIEDAEIVLSLAHCAHQVLCRAHPIAFSRERIRKFCEASYQVLPALVHVVRSCPEPTSALISQAENAIASEFASGDRQRVLRTMLFAAQSIQRTNLDNAARVALSFKINSEFFLREEFATIPYAIYFVSGRAFDGFHVRFSDIARGGLRIVRTVSSENYTREQDRLYEECYGLAYAQHLKNKDIPEGGAKAVILVAPGHDHLRCGRTFVDSLLDHMTPSQNGELRPRDTIYLGPDENVTDALIEWCVGRAVFRNYSLPNALMSSKPGTGINHRAYGVTSEGVAVFLEAALKFIGINPRETRFTIKLTGGPDGDVAGNLIKILIREFGDNVCFVGLADGSGVLEDSQGLSHKALLQMVEQAKPLSDFPISEVSDSGRLMDVSSEEGLRARNSFHFRVTADAFVPAGGRPRAISSENWQQFLSSDGQPSARVIVEGANLFLTQSARKHLSEQGVLIVKDSSANKCGVICSSFEILASMLLSDEEFFEIKERFVGEVLERLRSLASDEASIILRELVHDSSSPLPEICERLGAVVNRVTDSILKVYEKRDGEDVRLFNQLFYDYLPRSLERFATEDRLSRIPHAYLQRTCASFLGSRIIYREGMSYLEKMADSEIGDLAFRYLAEEQGVKLLIEELTDSDLKSKERIAQIVEQAGAAFSLRHK